MGGEIANEKCGKGAVAIALITGGVGVVGTATAALVSWFNTDRQTTADAARLRADHQEADRRLRRDSYRALLEALEELDRMFFSFTARASGRDFDAWLLAFRNASVGVRLVEPAPVGAARRKVANALDDLSTKADGLVQVKDVPAEAAIEIAYCASRDVFLERATALADAMRSDLQLKDDSA